MNEHDGKDKLIRYGDETRTIDIATDLRDHVQIAFPSTVYVYLDHKEVVQLVHQLTDWLGWIAEV